VSARAGSLAAAALTLLAGCGGGDARPDPPRPAARDAAPVNRANGASLPPSDADAVRALLGRRAAALERGDAAAYAATATGAAQRRRDRMAARRAGRAGLIHPREVALTAERIDLVGDRAELRVRSSYRIRGIAGTFAAVRRVVAVRRGGWGVRAETSRRERHPWEVGRYALARGRHFTILVPAGLPTGALVTALEGGYARIRALLPGHPLRKRSLVVVAGGPAEALALTGSIRGVGGLAAVSDSQVLETGPARRVERVASQRLIVVWPRWSALPPAARERVVTHELTHAALADTTSGRTPAWLVEGVALYVSGDRRTAAASRLVRGDLAGFSAAQASAARRALSLDALARPGAIARLRGTGQAAAYAFSSAAAFRIAERYGRARLLRLYQAFNDEALRGRPGPAVADRAVRRVLGTSTGALERDLRHQLRAF
jgi:hypothetical protein